MGKVRVSTRVVTTHEVPSYGGFQLRKEELEMLAKKLATGSIPMNFQHDASRPLHPENVEAGVEQLEDGHWAVWADFDIEEGPWKAYQAEVEAAGAPGGMSITLTRPIQGMPTDAEILVIADAHHFTADDLKSAAEMLAGRTGRQSSAMHLYQFADISDARVVFELFYGTVMALGPNIVASYIYDALKGLGRTGKRTVIETRLRREADGALEVGFHVDTADPVISQMAINEMGRLLDNGAKGMFGFDGTSSYIEIVKPPLGADADSKSVHGEDL